MTDKNPNFFSKVKDIILKIPFTGKIFDSLNTYLCNHSYKSHVQLSVLMAMIIVITVQSMECLSFWGGIGFLFKNTYFFILNFLIVYVTLSLSFFIKKRITLLYLISLLWLILGFSNFLLIMHRPMPLSAIDFVIMSTTKDIIPHYMSAFHIFLCVIGVISAIAIFTVWFIKGKKYETTLKQAILPFVFSAIMLTTFLIGGSAAGNLNISYNDVKLAYNEHGFIYCFTSSLFAKGIPKPNDYSLNDIQLISDKYKDIKSDSTVTPNILVIQLESFFDTAKYSKYTLNKDPIPNFHRICNEFGTGSLVVPSNGGGTVNTEFEILTGMNLEYFGTIEYPYTTVLKNTSCESAAFLLDSYNYTSHAIHNHTGVFYSRNQAYPNLGFDYFTSSEFMQYEKAESGWAKDEVIFPSIVESLQRTEGNDFIFAVTVQGHGAYLDEDNPDIPYKILGREEFDAGDFKNACMYEYYCNILSETDAVIGQLYDFVMNSDEEFVVILYGDHLPSLDFDSSLYEYNSDYMTSYTMFTNIPEKFNYEFSDNLPAYRLMSSVFEELGIDSGLINIINRNHESSSYESDHKQIQYDMLYGNGYSYEDGPYKRKNTEFGYNQIIINSATYSDGFLTVKGENFTKDSEININGRERETAFVDSNTVVCSCSKLKDDDIISVCQTAVDGTKLYETVLKAKGTIISGR